MQNTHSRKQAAFESFDREEAIQMSSDRGFGFVFTTVFALIGILKHDSNGLILWAALASFTLLITLFKPTLLAPFNRLWMRFGLLLHKLMNPLIMGALFYGVLTPMGLLGRLFGADLLRLKFEDKATSYWVKRDPTQNSTLENQF